MKKQLLTGLACGVLMLGMAGVTYAVPITINITAEVASVGDTGGLLGGAINVGDILNGHYTYDTSTIDSNPANEYVGDYYHNSSPYGVTISGGGFIFETDPLNTNFLVEIVNDYLVSDIYQFHSYNNLPLSNGILVDTISWRLNDDTQTALSSDELPTSPPNLSDWQAIGGLQIMGSDVDPFGDHYFIGAHVFSVEVAAVPEPATLLLLGFGLLSLAGFRRKE